jgi:hydrogenase expression/formation protein HypC
MCLGIPGRIISLDDAVRLTATADIGGVHRQVNIACLVDNAHPPEACIGVWALIHAGFAMSRIDEAEAEETLRLLTELGEVKAELAQLRGTSAEVER